MLVSGFMLPADKVIKCEESDSVRIALDRMLDNKVSAVVVVKEGKPVGIITKTDTTKAYSKGVSLDASVKDIMTSDLKTVQHNVSRDRAARVIEGNKIHHAIVVGDQGQFLGIISSWDIAKECVLDDRAWPWIRHENGKAHVVSHPKA